jgi:hypothetical protein
MNNKEILANAPEGATHVLIDIEYHPTYVKFDMKGRWYFWHYPSLNHWYEMGKMPDNDIHSLADIARIVELEKELDQKSLYFVGYTNGNQIAYAKEDEGSFYVNTDNDCYIPVYMLAVHLHRLGGTASEEWMTVLQTKQLGEGVQP